MLGARHEIARLQSVFYREQFHKVLRWLIYSVAIIFFLIAIIIYLVLFQPAASYYGNTSEGRILPMPKAQLS